MNPLDMMGPEFLRFYLLWGAGVLGAALLIRSFLRSLPAPPSGSRWTPGVYPREGDAYSIALLRGGWREVVHTALARLFSTGMLALDGTSLRQGAPEDSVSLQPLESAVLSVAMGQEGLSLPRMESRARSAVSHYLRPLENELRQEGLLLSEPQLRGFEILRIAALLLLVGPGAAKLAVALFRWRFNVGFLILMMLAYTVAAFLLLRPPRRTRAGDLYLDWLKDSHKGLMNMLTRGRRESPGELALLAGIYGLQVVPTMVPLYSALQPHRRQEDGAGSGYGGGSCGSSDGGGGGCGGGGCGGGGCGGCGG